MITISQYKDPYEPISIIECHKDFESCSYDQWPKFGQGSWTLLIRMLVNSSIELTWILPTGPLSLQCIWDATVDTGCMVSSRRADLWNTALDWINLCSCKTSNPAKHTSDLSTWLLQFSERLELHAIRVFNLMNKKLEWEEGESKLPIDYELAI